MTKYEALANALFENACQHKASGSINIHFQINCRKCIASAFQGAVESEVGKIVDKTAMTVHPGDD